MGGLRIFRGHEQWGCEGGESRGNGGFGRLWKEHVVRGRFHGFSNLYLMEDGKQSSHEC